MTNFQIICLLKEAIYKIDKLKAVIIKYNKGHTYYKIHLDRFRLDLTGILKKIKNIKLAKNISEIDKLTNAFLALETPTKQDCETLINKIKYIIQDLELSQESPDLLKERVYDKGTPFDFHTDYKAIISGAKKEIFIIEPFINEDILEITLRGINPLLNIKILTSKYNADKRGRFTKVYNMFKTQHKGTLEVRESEDVHDRGVFLDNSTGWVLGQSIKDAGKRPTYLIKLTDAIKLENIYQKIWSNSSKIK